MARALLRAACTDGGGEPGIGSPSCRRGDGEEVEQTGVRVGHRGESRGSSAGSLSYIGEHGTMQGGQESSQGRIRNTRGRGSLAGEDQDSGSVFKGGFQDWKWDMEGRGRVAG